MSMQKAMATAPKTPKAMANHNNLDENYHNSADQSSRKRAERIAERKQQIPKLYRAIYDKAVRGNSRKSAMHVFCLECCGWQIKEVFLCTDLGCPLYPYRPKPRASQGAPEGCPNGAESNNSSNGDNYAK